MTWFLFAIAIVLVTLGVFGLIRQRNPINTMMCVLLIVNASILVLVTLDRIRSVIDGRFIALAIMVLTAILFHFGLGSILRIYRDKQMADIDEFKGMPD